MYSTTNRFDNGRDLRLAGEISSLRAHDEQSAQRLSVVALRHWEKAITGIVALPVAATLTAATTMMMLTSLVARAFELLELTLSEVGQRIDGERDARPSRRDVDKDAQS